MKKGIFTLLIILLWTLTLKAEVGDNMNLSIHIIGNDVPSESASYLRDRMSLLLAENGINSAISSNRFFIVAKPTIISQSITDGEPSMVSDKISITFRIGDVVENRVFTTCSQTYHGVGKSGQKAWANALAKLRSNPEISNFLSSAKAQISEYYNQQSQELIKMAQSQAKSDNFDEALATLSAIPTTIDNYDEVRFAIVEIYKTKCAHQNERALLSAKSYWASSHNRESAIKACRELSSIKSPSSEILIQVDNLISYIGSEVSSQDKREYELLKQKIANDHLLAIHSSDNETKLWSNAIQLGYEFLCSQSKPINFLTSFFNW